MKPGIYGQNSPLARVCLQFGSYGGGGCGQTAVGPIAGLDTCPVGQKPEGKRLTLVLRSVTENLR